MYKISIIEDDNTALQAILLELDEYMSNNNLEYKVTSFTNAENFLSTYNSDTDIVFMDIELPGINGMEASKLLRKKDKKVILVFVTNMASFAIDGYQVDALDFIVKPLKKATFIMKMNRIIEKANLKKDDFLSVSYNREIILINISLLMYVEVTDHYIYFHLIDKDYKIRGSLSHFENQLKQKFFLRCNNYTLVNPLYIKSVNQDNVIIEKGRIPISRQRKKAFLEGLSNYLGHN